MNKQKLTNQFNISEHLIVSSGRKCRQKARKIAKQNSFIIVFVFSKKNNPVYFCFYDPYTNNHTEVIHEVGNFMNNLNKSRKDHVFLMHDLEFDSSLHDIYSNGNNLISIPKRQQS